MFNKKATCLFISTLILSNPSIGKVSASLSQNEIAYGNGVSLIFESDNEIIDLPDLSPLEQLVKIQGKSQSSRVQVINGNVSKSYQIAFQIFPLKKGEIQIGPFDILGEKTEPLVLKVNENVAQSKAEIPSQETPKETPQISFETTLINPRIYEGELSIYQAMIYDDISLQDAELNMPNINGLNISVIDADKISKVIKDDKSVRLFKRFFTVTPTKEGVYTIKPATLTGYILDKTPQKSTDFMGDFFNLPFEMAFHSRKSKPVYFQSNENELIVLKKPTDWQGWWLPSQKATLSEEYKIPPKIRIGDIIERRITLTAKNVDVAKLPPFYHPQTDDLSSFSNPEERFSSFKDDAIISQSVQTFILAPQKEGKVIIPAVEVKYFNTQTNKSETLTLPEKEIFVEKSNVLPTSTTKETPPPSPIKETPTDNTDLVLKKNNINNTGVYLILIAGFIMIFSLLSAYFYKKKAKKITLIEKTEKKQRNKKKKKPLPDLYPF